MEKKLSVIMSVYNAEKYISECIESILNQTFTDFIFYIIDDNSNDNTVSKILSFQDKRIVLIQNKENIGLTKNLNKLLKLCKTEYIARMDGDDLAEKDRFEKQILFLEKNKSYGVCGTWSKVINEKGKIIGENKSVIKDEDIKLHLIIRNCMMHSSIMLKKEVLDKNKIKYDEKFYSAQDYKLWESLYEKTKFYNIPEFLMKYRVVSTSITKKERKNQEKRINYLSDIYEAILIKNNIFLNKYSLNLYVKNNNYFNILNSKENIKELIYIYKKIISLKVDKNRILEKNFGYILIRNTLFLSIILKNFRLYYVGLEEILKKILIKIKVYHLISRS